MMPPGHLDKIVKKSICFILSKFVNINLYLQFLNFFNNSTKYVLYVGLVTYCGPPLFKNVESGPWVKKLPTPATICHLLFVNPLIGTGAGSGPVRAAAAAFALRSFLRWDWVNLGLAILENKLWNHLVIAKMVNLLVQKSICSKMRSKSSYLSRFRN